MLYPSLDARNRQRAVGRGCWGERPSLPDSSVVRRTLQNAKEVSREVFQINRCLFLIVTWSGLLLSQQPATAPSGVVPQLVNFSGKAVDAQGKTIAGIAGVTFAIYKDQYEGAPLWMETQNVISG